MSFGGFAVDCVDAIACKPFSGVSIAGLTLLGVGTVTAITSGIIWKVRANRRNEIDAERESLIEERDGLAATLSRLDLRSEYRDDTHFVKLGVRF